jgi:hypothetical protein
MQKQNNTHMVNYTISITTSTIKQLISILPTALFTKEINKKNNGYENQSTTLDTTLIRKKTHSYLE